VNDLSCHGIEAPAHRGKGRCHRTKPSVGLDQRAVCLRQLAVGRIKFKRRRSEVTVDCIELPLHVLETSICHFKSCVRRSELVVGKIQPRVRLGYGGARRHETGSHSAHFDRHEDQCGQCKNDCNH